MKTEYKVVEHYELLRFELLINEAAKEGWSLTHFNSIYARLGSDHRDHHTLFHAILKRIEE